MGGLTLALFHTGWCAIYKADPGRFDTLYSFKTEAYEGQYAEFLSVRKVGKNEQKPVKFVRVGNENRFESADSLKRWDRSDPDGMVVAVLLVEKGNKEPTRFEVNPPDVSMATSDGTGMITTRWVGTASDRGLNGNLFATFLTWPSGLPCSGPSCASRSAMRLASASCCGESR